MHARRAVAALLTLAVGTLAAGQDLSAQACFGARPLPRCRSFWLTEFTLSGRLDPHPQTEDAAATLEVGYMTNVGGRSALGGALFLQGGEPVGGFGFRPRYRHWLGRQVSLDLAPGIVLKAVSGGQFTLRSPSFSGLVGLNVGPGLGLIGRVDLVRGAYGGFANGKSTGLAWYAGGRLGGWPGVVGLAGFLGLATVVAATW
jgi:hypothetical protein